MTAVGRIARFRQTLLVWGKRLALLVLTALTVVIIGVVLHPNRPVRLTSPLTPHPRETVSSPAKPATPGASSAPPHVLPSAASPITQPEPGVSESPAPEVPHPSTSKTLASKPLAIESPAIENPVAASAPIADPAPTVGPTEPTVPPDPLVGDNSNENIVTSPTPTPVAVQPIPLPTLPQPTLPQPAASEPALSNPSPTNPRLPSPAPAPAPVPNTLGLEVPTQFQGKTVRYLAWQNPPKVVALTFDDGPWPKSTPAVLKILQEQQVPASFFWIGRHLRQYPRIAEQVVAAGHVVGNHTWSHRSAPTDPATAAREIDDTAALINKVTGYRPELFRPPGGRLKNGLVAYANAEHYTTTLWTVDPHDYKPGATSAKILQDVLKGVHPGGIVLLHDGGGNRSATVAALPQMITALKSQGYEFVTLPQLLQMQQRQQLKPEPKRANISPRLSIS